MSHLPTTGQLGAIDPLALFVKFDDDLLFLRYSGQPPLLSFFPYFLLFFLSSLFSSPLPLCHPLVTSDGAIESLVITHTHTL